MKKFVLFFLAVIILAIIFHSPEAEKSEKRALDYSRPIFTGDHAVVCPISDFSDIRADHGQAALVDLFTITAPWHMKEKESQLGCDELIGGLEVHAVKMSLPSTLHWVQVNGTTVTLDSYLTNELQK